jgi:hypothetical protein
MAHDVFISHSTQDKTISDAICAALEGAGIRCWIAPRDVQPGRSFAGEIKRAIQNSKIMVLVFSAHTNDSEQVLREVQLAVKSHLDIIQFRLEEVQLNDDLEYFLGTPHWLDAMTPPVEKHIERLERSIKALLEVPGEPSLATSSSQATDRKKIVLPPGKRLASRNILSAIVIGLLALGVVIFVFAGWRSRQVEEVVKVEEGPSASPVTIKPPSGEDGWMVSDKYQREFEAQIKRGLYPYRVDGRVNGEYNEFRVTWKKASKDCGFAAHHGLTEQKYNAYNAQYTKQGLTLTTLTQFVNTYGVESYQAVWSQNCNSPEE